MPNKAIDAAAFCPFYLSESRLTITCEGIIGAATVSKFKTESKKKSHEDSFCTSRACAGCGIYSSIMDKYEDRIERKPPAIRH